MCNWIFPLQILFFIVWQLNYRMYLLKALSNIFWDWVCKSFCNIISKLSWNCKKCLPSPLLTKPYFSRKFYMEGWEYNYMVQCLSRPSVNLLYQKKKQPSKLWEYKNTSEYIIRFPYEWICIQALMGKASSTSL